MPPQSTLQSSIIVPFLIIVIIVMLQPMFCITKSSPVTQLKPARSIIENSQRFRKIVVSFSLCAEKVPGH
jgi:uncharacterized membrane protein